MWFSIILRKFSFSGGVGQRNNTIITSSTGLMGVQTEPSVMRKKYLTFWYLTTKNHMWL